MLAVRMRGQPRGPLNSPMPKEKRRTHRAQYTRFVEPYPAMPIDIVRRRDVPLRVSRRASHHLFLARGRTLKSIVGVPPSNRSAAIAGMRLDDRATVFANYAGRVAAGDELQLFCPSLPRNRYHPRHPVLLMLPLCAQQTLMGQPDRTRTLVVQARQNLRGLSVLGRRAHPGAAPEPAAPSEKLRILEPRFRRLGWHHDLRQGLHRRCHPTIAVRSASSAPAPGALRSAGARRSAHP